MKNIIILRDNGDYNYIYGALLVNDIDMVEPIKEEIKNIMNEYYENQDEVAERFGNTLEYVLFMLDGKFEYEFICEIQDAEI